ncbi:MAG TPA: hypothetical protein VNJ52_09305 [Patescibacteria group bacterium]|nr:hypothetical protein [Patescibacteria group bacterium]
MDFVFGIEFEGDAVAGINPNLVRQEGIGLFGLVLAFRTNLHVPGLLRIRR